MSASDMEYGCGGKDVLFWETAVFGTVTAICGIGTVYFGAGLFVSAFAYGTGVKMSAGRFLGGSVLLGLGGIDLRVSEFFLAMSYEEFVSGRSADLDRSV